MNKGELITEVAKKTGLSQKDTQGCIEATLQVITDTLKKQNEVALFGFGTFKVVKRKARTGRNPQTGATLKIPAKQVPVFRAGKELKKAVSK